MTFITGPILTTKSTPIIDSKAQEHVVELCEVQIPAGGRGAPRVRGGPPTPARAFLLLSMTLSLIVAFAALLYFLPRESARPTRYHGYCTIPIRGEDEREESLLMSMVVRPNYDMPLRWSQDDDDVQAELERTLRETFDIRDHVERISVMDNGKRVNFIHDFEQNTTEIEDIDRCFTTELNLDTVLPPSVLYLSIMNSAVFDLSRIRSAMAAQLPALTVDAMSPAMREFCIKKPVYRLLRQEINIIRKRAVDAPAHDYIQFSGRGIQEIEISNLAELLQHEQDAALAQR